MRRVRQRPLLVVGLLPLLGGAAPVPSADHGAMATLVDASERTGLSFHHVNGMTGLRHLVEMTGAGGGWIDFDGDGDLDAVLVQGGELDADREPLDPWQGMPGDVLLRNDLAAGGVRFVDWTSAAGLDSRGYGMGIATGDADGDGHVDLLITNFGVDELWRNRGDGTFEDASAALGAQLPAWSTSATFVDYDGDGDADLYIGRYVDYPLADPITCYAPSSRVDYCGPSAFPAQADRLLRNRGDGSFEEVSGPLGVDRLAEPALGVVALDADGDGGQEIYVANDGRPNLLWSFGPRAMAADGALLAGVAVNREGAPEAGMGIAAEDFDNDGDEDLLVTHLGGETDTLYVNRGSGLYEDRSLESGLGESSLPFTSFGVAWLDVDGDGWQDLAVVSGAVRILQEQAARGALLPLAEPGRLLRNVGGRRLEPVGRGAEALVRPGVGRGLAAGDVDNDGDVDLLATYNGGDARLLEVAGTPGAGSWLGVRLLAASGAPVSGATLLLETPEGGRVGRAVRTDGSYCSARDPRAQLRGLGGGEALRVRFRDGRELRLPAPPLGTYVTLREPSR